MKALASPMKALAFDTSVSGTRTVVNYTQETQFPYGWRYVTHTLPSGEEIYNQVPLTAEDLLSPQLGDQVPQRNQHFQVMLDLASMLKTHYANDPTTGVFGDLIMKWGLPGVREPAPDIAVVPHLKNKEADRGTFDVVTEGTRPCFVMEVMSPGYPGDDTTKVKIYEQAGIQEYFLIDPHAKPAVQITGYRLVDGQYQPILPDDQGRLFSHTLQLWFGVSDQGQSVQLQDARTNQWLLTQTETEAQRQKEQAGRLAAETRAQEATARAQEAETRAQAEATARTQLEKRLQELEALLKLSKVTV